MRTLIELFKGAELLTGTIVFFAILGSLAVYAYMVLARTSDERAAKITRFLDSHFRLLGLAALLVFLLFAILFQILAGK